MWSEEEEDGSWANQLREIDGKVLIPWMKTMFGEVGTYYVVLKVVEGRYYGVIV